MNNFIQLITSDNEVLLTKLSVYVYKALMIRSNLYRNNVEANVQC